MVLTRDVEPNTHLGLMGQNVSLERSVIPGGLSLVALFPWVQAEDISQNHPTLMPVKWGMALTAVVEAQSSSMCFKPGGAWAISSPDNMIKVACLA